MKRLASLARLVPLVFAILTVPLVFCAVFGHVGTQFLGEMGYTGVLFLLVAVCLYRAFRQKQPVSRRSG
jgi:hypothetical protein